MNQWFGVDKEGLRKLIEQKGRFFVIAELVQNAWDEDTHRVQITLESIGHGKARLVVKDDNPDGFKDITHAYTLFAESAKKNDPEKRGRFNLGEKLVLALCDSAEIISVKHGVKFNIDGTRSVSRKRTEAGTVFDATIRMTKAQVEEVGSQVNTLIPPEGIETSYNGVVIPSRQSLKVFHVPLPTLMADAEGYLKPTVRGTQVEVLAPHDGETPMIYELGIPVVESQMPYHVNVKQKVPLNQDRDNVTPRFFQRLATAVVEAMHDDIAQEETAKPWVATALEDENIDPIVVRAVVTKRFGEKVVSFNPGDMEANRRAAAAGYHVLPGNAFSTPTWEIVRASEAVKASSQVFPTKKAFSDDPNAPLAEIIPMSNWTEGMHEVVDLTKRLFMGIFDQDVNVTMYKKHGTAAFYAADRGGALGMLLGGYTGPVIGFSLQTLGHKFFDQWQERLGDVLELLIHEFAHHVVSEGGKRPDTDTHHVTKEFEDALELVGAKMAVLAIQKPEFFKPRAKEGV